MLVSDFDYDCPEERIAQYPSSPRSASRLLRINRQKAAPQDCLMADLPRLLHPDDLLIFNDTKVVAARLQGWKSSGGKVEVFLERLMDDRRALVHLRSSKPCRPGGRIEISSGDIIMIEDRNDDLFIVSSNKNMDQIFSEHGEVPLPPYIQRSPEPRDKDSYQTVFAKHPGAVAAPTAGLHFDQALLTAMAERGIQWSFVTLHVGLATFQPLRVENIQQHKMHSEKIWVSAETIAKINRCRENGGRIVAVGTTSVRCLESLPDNCKEVTAQDTCLFIYPGYRFKNVDAMLTNFHLPRSTLLMLVCAFAGKEKILSAYRHAIDYGYRFYSYGDAMLIE